jgi:hypothetical protein
LLLFFPGKMNEERKGKGRRVVEWQVDERKFYIRTFDSADTGQVQELFAQGLEEHVCNLPSESLQQSERVTLMFTVQRLTPNQVIH